MKRDVAPNGRFVYPALWLKRFAHGRANLQRIV
jgi:hypothetical protein